MRTFVLRTLRLAAAAAAILACSAAVAWPLWALATRSRGLYTALVVGTLALLAGRGLIARARRRAGKARR